MMVPRRRRAATVSFRYAEIQDAEIGRVATIILLLNLLLQCIEQRYLS